MVGAMTEKPISIQDLHRLLQQDRERGKGNELFGPKARNVLVYMLSSPGIAAVASITEIAEAVQVDPSTLTRLGQRLGFSGFNGLQNIFQGHVKETQPFYSSRINHYVKNFNQEQPKDFLEKHLQAESQKLVAVVRQLSSQDLHQAAKWIANANTVYVLGMRATYGLSFYLASYLSSLRPKVRAIGTPGYSLAYDLSDIGEGDIVVAISFTPYTRAALQSVDVAFEQGAKVLAITNPSSPLILETEGRMALVIDQPYYFDSSTAHFFVVQSLLIASAQYIGDSAVAMAKRREKIHKALDIEFY